MCPVCMMLVEQATRSAMKTSVASSWHFISTNNKEIVKVGVFRYSDISSPS